VRRLEWRPLAESDLLAIVAYIGRDDPHAARALVQSIHVKAQGLRARPTLYRNGRTREMVVHRNYVVFYRVTAKAITILRVKYARQQWPS
jgi:plasmid stabilization system protein ParE